MNILKNVLAVIAGYLIFAVSSVVFFKLSHHPPHTEASTIFKFATLGYGLVIAIIAGFICRIIAGSFSANLALAILMFTLALLSMLMASGASWTQWFTMLFFAPASILGGYLRTRNK